MIWDMQQMQELIETQIQVRDTQYVSVVASGASALVFDWACVHDFICRFSFWPVLNVA